ncbi:4-hydroxy-3-polyprenylbenzoate decarboxylase [Nannocystis exedens]|uniref:4-hydroxy-3-polyprenylbenzoate decarboxylase n=1 Tax=Nannocystis exedens TaxID=54 RepID=A0A1I1W1H3_9BACT|nr:UbiD family decarboxylase [Nannocystis exedens]PCC72870.1 3-octaprenyl-4-hydroxybenzoate carboxy-lyase [Nannocystis exedens]SFD86790.1 4-hydroxy-3-polyprenylbenzoate decarboxylase [Nannocystis exedens]
MSAYRSLRECVADLERHGHLARVDVEVDPYLEAAEIQRRVYEAGGPALLFPRVKGSAFPMVSNLFGTPERTRFLFRDTLARVKQLVALRGDPGAVMRRPWRYVGLLRAGWHARPKFVGSGPVMAREIRISDLPQLVSWPLDGGPFITLPQVYSEDPERPGWMKSNLGMYRVQLGGGRYAQDRQIGLHYQIHRGIGVHHAAAIRKGEPLRVNIFVGGPPAMTLAAVMPLPEGLPELAFAGALAGRRVRMVQRPGELPFAGEADFVICGTVDPELRLPEGPFGDHLGYYSLAHDFPVLRVEKVYARADAIWPFTVVGRPPQEDTQFGAIIHEITGPAIPAVIPGVHAVHAVDAAGVHPLLLALGSERYTPWAPRDRPAELLTQASAILGQGQMSLAKVLIIAAADDAPNLDLHDVTGFFGHVLERVDWRRDLHFHTETTIDTLDYSGGGLNVGSKVVIAAVGAPRRALPAEVPADLRLPPGFSDPRVCMPGVLAVTSPACAAAGDGALQRFCAALSPSDAINRFPLVVLVDDSEFAARTTNNFLWATFTRMNPAVDIEGVAARTVHKHWGCEGSLVIDARRKPHHAPQLIEDPAVTRRVLEWAAPGGPLHGLF